jgi:hypothetical protein
MDRDEMRMKLWCDAYIARIVHPGVLDLSHESFGTPVSPYQAFANSAVEHFDAAFPEPVGVPSEPPYGPGPAFDLET